MMNGMNENRKNLLILSAFVSLLLVMVALWIPNWSPKAGTTSPAADSAGLSVGAECQLALGYPSRSAEDLAWLRTCITALNEHPTPGVTPTEFPTAPTSVNSTSPPTSLPPSSTQPPTSGPVSTAPTTPTPSSSSPTTGPVPPLSSWPGVDSTGVPSGTVLSTHTGTCTITAANTAFADQVFNCDVIVRAANVTFTNVRILGTLSNDPTSTNAAFSIVDSEINCAPGAPRQVTCLAHNNFVAKRVEITGGNRGAYCQRTCVVEDSWIHGTKITSDWHASAIRMEQGGVIRHNTLVCDAPVQANPEGSCSATLTGYGDYAAVQNNLIDSNLFMPTLYAAYCAYGGSSKGKPFSSGANHIVFQNNVFVHGTASTNEDCALYGPIGDWDPTKVGNVWINNRWNNGQVIPNRAS